MKVYCVRIGNKYGPEYEEYINEKLKKYDVHWIREPYDKRVPLQWNKLLCMSFDDEEPIVVLDIDVILSGNYEQLFDYPIERGEFLSIPHWWSSRYPEWQINGGFQKYYPVDCNYIFEIFMENVKHWLTHYIKQGLTIGPVNGEQFFVEEHVKQKLNLKTVPAGWVTRWSNQEDINNFIIKKHREIIGNELFQNNEFNTDLKLIHFTTSLNKPHNSSLWK